MFLQRSIVTVLALFAGMASYTTMLAAEPVEQTKITDEVNYSFGKVWAAMKAALAETGCTAMQVDKVNEPLEGSVGYSGTYRSDFCVMVTGEDSTEDKMELYGDLPRIRQAIWTTGRVQYTIRVNETGVRKCSLTIEAGLSGYEEYITGKVHFWNSNGVLEKQLHAALLKQLQTAKDE